MKNKKIFNILLSLLVFVILIYFYHLLKTNFPNNLISKILSGFKLVLTPTLTALFITYLMEPFMHTLRNKFKFSKFLSVLTTTLLVIVVLVGFTTFVIFFAVDQMRNIYSSFIASDVIHNIEQFFYKYNLENIYKYISEFITNIDYSTLLSNYISKALRALAQTLTIIILTPIFLWHFLNARKELFLDLGSIVPNKYKDDVFEIASRSNDVIISYFKSKVLSMLFLFIAFMFLFIALGISLKFVFFFAILITIFDLIPYIGPFVANAIPIIYILANGGTNIFYINKLFVNGIFTSIILVVVNLVFQFIQGNLIIPKLAGKEMKIHPLIILSSMLFFGAFLGIWGIVLSIPLGGIVIVIYKYYKEKSEVNLVKS